ncbi:hypothetical protein [Yinghuangia seranimata]|uniref:hypothetical protein n=1 Tax=Yinghuangia seranimata TaxID=408067 RepID=UPI00248C3973|nr:hypothetical protein [Yinghuangia seranimata]MDI2124621.1 hypothetical protein [Yinghuangia seranimata]
MVAVEDGSGKPPPRPGEESERDGALYYRGYSYAADLTDLSPLAWAGLSAAGAGFVVLAGTLVTPRRAARLLTGTSPARLVLAREPRPGRTVVYPADDHFGHTPLFVCDLPGPGASERMSEAVLYGMPVAGAAVALTVPGGADATRTAVTRTALTTTGAPHGTGPAHARPVHGVAAAPRSRRGAAAGVRPAVGGASAPSAAAGPPRVSGRPAPGR